MPYTFRFHTGSIKSLQILVQKVLMSKFRFHTGSIKSIRDRSTPRHHPEFRFHTGSIKSAMKAVNSWVKSEFRFHTGSIKRRQRDSGSRELGIRFDSILVRLKVFPYGKSSQSIIGFDSILVRLKVIWSLNGMVRDGRVSIPYWFD